MKYLYAEHVFGWGAEQVWKYGTPQISTLFDIALVGLLHQLYRQRASAPHPSTDAVYVFFTLSALRANMAPSHYLLLQTIF